MSAFLDRILALLKWPTGLAALALFPASAWSLYDLSGELWEQRHLHLTFWLGLVGYWLAWKLFLSKPAWGSIVSTFEHELTHAVFAWLTFHRVVDFKVTWKRGGHMRLVGGGNWLIAIAPYFFPTAAVLLLVLLIWVPGQWLAWGHAVLGASVAYHMTSTWIETHRQQPDLHLTGFAFAWCFLPTANLVSYGLIGAFLHGGSAGTSSFLREIYVRSLHVMETII